MSSVTLARWKRDKGIVPENASEIAAYRAEQAKENKN